MNRSLTRRALRAYDATANRPAGAEIDVAVVFPHYAFTPWPDHWSPGAGFRPFAPGCWLRSTGPRLRDGVLIAGPLPVWDENAGDYREHGETWTVNVTDDGYPNVATIIDKKHRVRHARDEDSEATVIEVASAADAPSGQLADALLEQHGFVPELDGWLWPGHPYGERWFLAWEWTEPDRDTDVTFTEFLTLLDYMIRRYRARVIFHEIPSPWRPGRWIRHEPIQRDWAICRRVLTRGTGLELAR